MNKLFIFLISLGLSQIVMANKGLDAHEHGSVKLDFAVEGKQLMVTLDSPAESFLGFEYKAKTTQEKALEEKVKVQWEKEVIKLLGDGDMKECQITKASWKHDFEGEGHSDIEAEAYINCPVSVTGRTIKTKFFKTYPHIKELKVQLLREKGQPQSLTFTKDFELKL